MYRKHLLYTVQRSLLCTKPKKPPQETANQEPLQSNKYDRNSPAHYLSYKNHSLSVSSNEQCKLSVHFVAEQETRLLFWIGGKLLKSLVQIRCDGFINTSRNLSPVYTRWLMLWTCNYSCQTTAITLQWNIHWNITKHTWVMLIQLLARTRLPIQYMLVWQAIHKKL